MAEPYDAPTTDELEAMFAGVEPPMNRGDLVAPPQRGRDLGAGSTMVQDQIITAQQVNVPRDNAKILQGLKFAAAYAGQDVLTYRWLVNNRRTGKQETIKGLTIKAADILLREYTNAFIDLRFSEGPVSWIYKATFCDIERGIARPAYWQEYKDTATLGAKDKSDQRLKQIPFQIGQSKAMRNVIVKYLEIPYGTYLEAEAENNLVERVGKNLEAYRQRCAKAFADLGIELTRVERQVGRKLAEWLAPDVAIIVQQLKAVRDGMASASDQWPAPPPPEPKRSDTPAPDSAAASPSSPNPADAAGGPAMVPPNDASSGAETSEPSPQPSVDLWRVADDVVGQDAVWARLRELIEQASTRAELDAIERLNAVRVEKFAAGRRAQFSSLVLARHQAITPGGSSA